MLGMFAFKPLGINRLSIFTPSRRVLNKGLNSRRWRNSLMGYDKNKVGQDFVNQ